MFLQTSISLGDIYAALTPYILSIVTTLAAAFVVWLGELLRRKFDLQIDAAHRDALQTALTNAAGLAIERGAEIAASKSISVPNPVLAASVDYVLKAVPDAIKHFGLTPEAISEKIKAKLGTSSL